MSRERVLVIEDEEDIAELIRYNLEREGYQISLAASGEIGVKMARNDMPDLIILDLMLPGLDGLDVCKVLKGDSKTKEIPVVIVTAKGEESDIVTGLEVGADDYLTKPFSPKVLIARIRSVMRRRLQPTVDSSASLRLPGLTIDPNRHDVRIEGKHIELTLTEFQILHLLARRPGWVYTRYQIVNEIRGEDIIVTDRSVDVQIVGLRRKLGNWGKQIETVRGVGYRLKE